MAYWLVIFLVLVFGREILQKKYFFPLDNPYRATIGNLTNGILILYIANLCVCGNIKNLFRPINTIIHILSVGNICLALMTSLMFSTGCFKILMSFTVSCNVLRCMLCMFNFLSESKYSFYFPQDLVVEHFVSIEGFFITNLHQS